jgi:hypothetical protein
VAAGGTPGPVAYAGPARRPARTTAGPLVDPADVLNGQASTSR